jgi:hypothetical protein
VISSLGRQSEGLEAVVGAVQGMGAVYTRAPIALASPATEGDRSGSRKTRVGIRPKVCGSSCVLQGCPELRLETGRNVGAGKRRAWVLVQLRRTLLAITLDEAPPQDGEIAYICPWGRCPAGELDRRPNCASR